MVFTDGGGRQPYWRGDGRELFYVSDAPTMYAVDIRDGQRFLINQALDDDVSAINVVVNWPAELGAR